MQRLLRDQDFLAGLAFIAFAAAYGFFGSDLAFGTLRRMGPGFFPAILECALAGIGFYLAARAVFTRGDEFRGFAGKAILLVGLAVVSFGLLIRSAGLLVAILAVVLISSLASTKARPLSAVLLAIVLCIFSAAVFVRGLGLPMPLLGYWFAG